MNRLTAATLVLASVSIMTPVSAPAAPGDLALKFGGFGDGGKIADLGFSSRAIAIDTQGRLVITGVKGGTFHVQRRSGPHFLTVEETSITILSFQLDATARAVAIAPDGKIVVGGSARRTATANDWAVARFQEDGTLDPTFSGNGKWTFDYGPNNNFAYALALDGDKILVAGDVYDESKTDFAVMRLNADGSEDDTFDGDGFVRIDFGSDEEPLAVAVGPRHEVVLAGGTTSPGVINVARILEDGTPDDDFGNDGRATTTVDGPATAFAVAVQPDGKIIAAGRNFLDADPDRFVVVRYEHNGNLDVTYGDNGVVLTSFGSAEAGIGTVALQPDGWLLAASGPQAARYRADGSLDAGGIVQVVFDQLQVDAQAGALTVDSQNRLIAAGSVSIAGSSYDAALARFRADEPGSLGTDFGNGDPKLGVSVYGTGLDEQINAIELEGDKLVQPATRVTLRAQSRHAARIDERTAPLTCRLAWRRT